MTRDAAGGAADGRIYARMVAVVAALAVGLSAYLGHRLYQDAVALSAAPIDNVQWTLSRLEVETLRLQRALADDEVALAEARRRFDVFFSRVNVFRQGDAFGSLRDDPDTAAEIAAFSRFLDEVTPVFDGPDAGLAEARSRLARRLDEMRAHAADLSLDGIAIFAAKTALRRSAFERLVFGAAILAVGLIAVLAATLLALSSRNRAAMRKDREAEASGARLKAVVEVALDPIIVADDRGRIIEANAAAEQVFGYSREEAVGADLAELIVPRELREAHWAGMIRRRAGGEARVAGKGRLELEAIRKSGERFPVEVSIGEARTSDGDRRIYVGFLRDISHRKETEAELTTARDAAMAADRAKSEFIAVMSHEMRTPLNGVLGVMDLLGETALTAEQTELVDVAIRSGEILLRHINDVLDITRIEARRIEIQEEPLDIPAILEEAAAVGRPAATARGVTVAATSDLAGAALAGDGHRIRQVLLNLVGNAVKFTASGRIEVRAARIGGATGADLVEFSVRDTGPGIAPEDQARIFEDFVMIDAEYSREAGGSGLGLSICRRIVRAMGGEIGVNSAPGEGSRFWFRLHLSRVAAGAGLTDGGAAQPPALAGPNAAAEDRPLDVLLVEDNEVNRMVARRMLTGAGHRVVEARDGLEGVEAAAARRFDAILMDISMPRLDGMEATRRIRAGGGASATTPILGVTAHASTSEQEAFREAGMDACLTKPVRRDAIARALSMLASGRTPQAEDALVADECEPDGEAPVIDEEVFDEFIASLTPEMLDDMVARVDRELTAAAEGMATVAPCHALAAHAHMAAGAAALVGASRAHAALAAVETAAKSGRRDTAAIASAQQEMTAAASVIREFAG